MSNSLKPSSGHASLLLAAVRSRAVFELLRTHDARREIKGDASLGALWRAIDSFYSNDQEAQAASGEAVYALASEHCIDDKQRDKVRAVLDAESDLNETNALEALRAEARSRLRLEMADALLSHDDEDYQRLLGEYQAVGTLKEAIHEVVTITADGLTADVGEKFAVAPPALNRALGGGMRRGQTLLLFGRPGSGKTLVAMNVVYGFLAQGLRVLYIGNEEAIRMLQLRLLSRMSGVALRDLEHTNTAKAAEYIRKAVAIAEGRKSDNCKFVHGVTHYSDVEKLIDDTGADVVVIDQVRHMRSANGDAGLTSELEYAARELRDVANRKQVIGIGISQAGAEAEGRAVLRLTDLDSSKTGVQGALEVIVGIGVNEQLIAQNSRVLSICRNKVSGIITHFQASVDEQTTKIIAA